MGKRKWKAKRLEKQQKRTDNANMGRKLLQGSKAKKRKLDDNATGTHEESMIDVSK